MHVIKRLLECGNQHETGDGGFTAGQASLSGTAFAKGR